MLVENRENAPTFYLFFRALHEKTAFGDGDFRFSTNILSLRDKKISTFVHNQKIKGYLKIEQGKEW